MWKRWGPCADGEQYLPSCPALQTYQFPLKKGGTDVRWGKVDLLGVGVDRRPVVNELKREDSAETVLRMLIEMAAYGLAVQECWPFLAPIWSRTMERRFGEEVLVPDALLRPTVIGIAPTAFWKRQIATTPGSEWPHFFALVGRFQQLLDVRFAIVDGTDTRPGHLPLIHGATEFDLQAAVARGAL
jgi:hypothetical protein